MPFKEADTDLWFQPTVPLPLIRPFFSANIGCKNWNLSANSALIWSVLIWSTYIPKFHVVGWIWVNYKLWALLIIHRPPSPSYRMKKQNMLAKVQVILRCDYGKMRPKKFPFLEINKSNRVRQSNAIFGVMILVMVALLLLSLVVVTLKNCLNSITFM